MTTTPTNADDWVGTIAAKAKVSPDEVQAVLDRHGIVVASTPEDYARSLQSEIALTEKMMKVAGIAAQ